MTDMTIRRAGPNDVDLIFTLLMELAEYEKLTHVFALTKAIIARDFLEPNAPVICDLAYERENEPVGLATWYWTYTTFAATRGIYLEDLYVRERARGRGHGKALLAHLAREAVKHGASRVEWSVLNWNKPSIDFYDSLGAKPSTEWTVYRLSEAPLKKLAEA